MTSFILKISELPFHYWSKQCFKYFGRQFCYYWLFSQEMQIKYLTFSFFVCIQDIHKGNTYIHEHIILIKDTRKIHINVRYPNHISWLQSNISIFLSHFISLENTNSNTQGVLSSKQGTKSIYRHFVIWPRINLNCD